jgi:hypothetical protein
MVGLAMVFQGFGHREPFRHNSDTNVQNKRATINQQTGGCFEQNKSEKRVVLGFRFVFINAPFFPSKYDC